MSALHKEKYFKTPYFFKVSVPFLATKSDDHYINYLSRPEISNVEVHECLTCLKFIQLNSTFLALDEIHDNGEIPDPKLIEAGLRACHRINDLDLTVSLFETIKAKCGSKKNLDCLIQQVGVVFVWFLMHHSFPD